MNKGVENFRAAVDRYSDGGSPIELRNLLLTAADIVAEQTPLPALEASVLKKITGVLHKTYGSAAKGLMATHFDGTGNFWLAFYRAGRSADASILSAFRRLLKRMNGG